MIGRSLKNIMGADLELIRDQVSFEVWKELSFTFTNPNPIHGHIIFQMQEDIFLFKESK